MIPPTLAREKFNIKESFILTVANVDERKNLARLVEACEKLEKKLVLIGDVRQELEFEKIKNSKSLIYLGPISDEAF